MKPITSFTTALLAIVMLAAAPVGLAQAQVKVTAATPSSTQQGTASLDVTIDGSGFNSSAKPRFLVTGTSDTGGITVTKVVVRSANQLVATIDVADTAVVNKFDIEVTLSSGRKGKGTTLFTVLKKAVTQLDPCIGAESRRFPSFAFTRQATINGVVTWKTILADAIGQCEKVVATYSYNTFNSDVSFRYDATSRTGVIVRRAADFNLVAARVGVVFDASGVPVVEAGTYSSILTAADLPPPPDLLAGGWTLSSMGTGYFSPDGATLLLRQSFINAASEQTAVLWTCPFDVNSVSVDRGNCRNVYIGRSEIDQVTDAWSGRGNAIYILQDAVSGSGMALYRLTLSDGHLQQMWSRGTLLTFARATLDSSLRERVAVYEPDLTSSCGRVLVIDPDTCSNNNCQILNGAGHSSRGLTWLPDGRVAGDGQTAPNRRGRCSAAGSITVFDPNDTSGSTTTLVTDGYSPHGVGGD